MPANAPLVFGILIAMAVMIGFLALSRMIRPHDIVDDRLHQYGSTAWSNTAGLHEEGVQRPRWSGMTRLLNGFGLGPELSLSLMRADMSLTAAEFSLIVAGCALAGLVLVSWRAGPLVGLIAGILLALVPVFYLNHRKAKRLRAFTEQLPDVLTLLIGALRAGYGLAQAMEMVAHQSLEPVSGEFQRAVRAISLGVSTNRALNDMVDRVGSDDLTLVATAMNVQYEVGGDLAATLDTISDTIRDRIGLKRQVRVFTSQQRLTGYVLAGLPIILAVVMFMLNPEYMSGLFQPGWILLPVVGLVMILIGFLIIRRVVDIEV
jgi:tight adherence protein B